MGQFAISSKRDADPEGLVSGVELADADIDRITIAYAQLYFPQGVLVPGWPEIPGTPGQEAIPYQPAVPPTLDEDGNVIDPGQPEVIAQDAVPEVPAVPAVLDSYRAPTGEEVFAAMAEGLLRGIIDNTIRVEKTNAAHQGAEAVPDIPVVINP